MHIRAYRLIKKDLLWKCFINNDLKKGAFKFAVFSLRNLERF